MRITLPELDSSKMDVDWLKKLDSALQLLSIRYGPYVVNTDYTFSGNDEIDSLQVDATGGSRIVTLPPPIGSRRRRVIKVDSAPYNTVTLTGGTINGASSYILTKQYQFIEVEPTGTAWIITNIGEILINSSGNAELNGGDRSLSFTVGGAGGADYGVRFRVHDTGSYVYLAVDTLQAAAWTNDRLVILSSNGYIGWGTIAPKSPLHFVGIPVFANNAAALLGGLTAGAFYRTGADPDPICIVH